MDDRFLCHIFGAMDPGPEKPLIADGDWVIAADGGLRYLSAWGITPDVILGDFDSLGYIPENSLLYPVEKDDTDTLLAVKQGLSAGAKRFRIYGGMGGRFSHTLANVQTLLFLKNAGAEGELTAPGIRVRIVKNETVTFSAGERGLVSLIAMGGTARGVSIRGLKYELENGALTTDYPLGVSNAFVGTEARVTVADGTAILILEDEGKIII